MTRIGNAVRATALRAALGLGLAGTTALMGGCHDAASGALLGAWLGAVIGGEADAAAAGALIGAGIGAAVGSEHDECGCGHLHQHAYYRYDY